MKKNHEQRATPPAPFAGLQEDDNEHPRPNGENRNEEAAANENATIDWEKVSKLVAMLSSDNNNEVLVAVRAIRTSLGGDWHTLIARIREGARGATDKVDALDGYEMRHDGLWFSERAKPMLFGLLDPKPQETLLSGPFKVKAKTADNEDYSHGLLLEWVSGNGVTKTWAMPKSMLAGDGIEARRMLLDGGLYIAASNKARTLLTNYFNATRCVTKARAVAKTGWFGSAFVFPDETIGGNPNNKVFLQSAKPIDHAYYVKGTLAAWQDGIARYAVGNSRLVLAISLSFAAVFVGPCGQESGGVHLKGKSSGGKTTTLRVGGSAWGGSNEPRGFLRSWRLTDNNLEGTAAVHNDAALFLDEISQLPSKVAGQCAYMLANGMGKGRMTQAAELRKILQWSLLFLSSGEMSLGDKIAEDPRNRKQTAGQEVRVIDLPSDTGRYVLFDELHGFENGTKFSDYLIAACKENYGTPIRAFIEMVAANLESFVDEIKGGITDFIEDVCPVGSDGQVNRVAARFGLIAAAGELATRLGVLPWSAGEATKGMAICFAAWIAERGGVGATEVRDGIDAVREFLTAHHASRFLPAWDPPLSEIRNTKIAGFRRRAIDDANAWDYYVTGGAWKEIAAGLDKRALAETLVKRGFMIPESDRNRMIRPTIPGFGQLRVYHISHTIFEEDIRA